MICSRIYIQKISYACLVTLLASLCLLAQSTPSPNLAAQTGLVSQCTTADYGIWFYNPEGNKRKFEKDADMSGFYDPAKPTLLFVHDIRQGAVADGASDAFYYLKMEGQPDVYLPKAWLDDGYNFAVFDWTILADEDQLTRAEAKIWDAASMRWRRTDGTFSKYGLSPSKNVADLLGEAFEDVFTTASGNTAVRLAGHGLGGQLVVQLAFQLANSNQINKVERVVLLNSYWSAGSKGYLGGKTTGEAAVSGVMTLNANNVLVEYYKSVDFSVAVAKKNTDGSVFPSLSNPSYAKPLYAGDDNKAIKKLTAHLRLDPQWHVAGLVLPEVNAVYNADTYEANAQTEPNVTNINFPSVRKQHDAAYLWYLNSRAAGVLVDRIKSRKPLGENGQEVNSQYAVTWEEDDGEGLSALTAYNEAKSLVGTNYFLQQIKGQTTPTAADDKHLKEHLCVCELDPTPNPALADRGMLLAHDVGFREYAHSKDLMVMVNNGPSARRTLMSDMYSDQSDVIVNPLHPLKFPFQPVIGQAFGPNSPYAAMEGRISISPYSKRTRASVHPDLYDLTIDEVETERKISREYAHFFFYDLLLKGYYVWPMTLFDTRTKDGKTIYRERWYDTYRDVLVEKKLQQGWVIKESKLANGESDYQVRDSLGRLLFEGYELHGVYNMEGKAWNKINSEAETNLLSVLNEDYLFKHAKELLGAANKYKLEPYWPVQHGMRDLWEDRNNWSVGGPKIGPRANLTVYMPSSLAYLIPQDSVLMQKRFYDCIRNSTNQSSVDMNWSQLYPTETYETHPDDITADEIEVSNSLGGYPAVSSSSSGQGIPTASQRSYTKSVAGVKTPGVYNVKGQYRQQVESKFKCAELLAECKEAEYDPNNVQLSADVIEKIKGRGMHPHHYERMIKFAGEFNVSLIVRNSNGDAYQWVDSTYRGAPFRPKPFAIKGKSIKREAYQSFKNPADFLTYANGTENCAGAKKIGPGFGTTDDKNCRILDFGCDLKGGLASFDPRTARGRGLIDPQGKFEACDDNFEITYGHKLQEKMLAGEYFVYPIPYFANKYQWPFRVDRIPTLGTDGEVLNKRYTDQLTNPVILKLRNKNGDLPVLMTGQGSQAQFNISGQSKLYSITDLVDGSNGSADEVYVYAYRRNSDNTAGDFIWKKPIKDMKPENTTYVMAYEVDAQDMPVWITLTEWTGQLGLPESQYLTFDSYEKVEPGVPFYKWHLSKKTNTPANEAIWNQMLVNWKNTQNPANWVQIYYEILFQFFHDPNRTKTDPNLSLYEKYYVHRDPCYMVKDIYGNKYYSDYDVHGYFYSAEYGDEPKDPAKQLRQGTRWWPTWTLSEDDFKNRGEGARQLVSYYLMKEFPFEAPTDHSNWESTYETMKDYYTSYATGIETLLSDIDNAASDPNRILSNSWDTPQHGAHDDWTARNNYAEGGVNMGPQGDLTFWVPTEDGKVVVYSLNDKQETMKQEQLYECLGIDFQVIYPQVFFAPSSYHPQGSKFMKVVNTTRSNSKLACTYWSDQNTKECKFTWEANIAGCSVDLKKYGKLVKALQLDPTADLSSLMTENKACAPAPSCSTTTAATANTAQAAGTASLSSTSRKATALQAWPNPNRESVLHLQFTSTKAQETALVTVSHVSGTVVFEKQVRLAELANYQIDVSKLSSGMYVVKVVSGQVLESKKINIMKQ